MAQRFLQCLRALQSTPSKDWVLERIEYEESEREEIFKIVPSLVTTHVLVMPRIDDVVVLVIFRRENGNSYLEGLRAFFWEIQDQTSLDLVMKIQERFPTEKFYLRVCDNFIWDFTDIPLEQHEKLANSLIGIEPSARELRVAKSIPGPLLQKSEKIIRQCCSIYPDLLKAYRLSTQYEIFLHHDKM